MMTETDSNWCPEVLDGRRLYLLKDEIQLGRDLLDRFGIEGHGDTWSPTASEKFLKHFVKGKLSLFAAWCSR